MAIVTPTRIDVLASTRSTFHIIVNVPAEEMKAYLVERGLAVEEVNGYVD